MTLFAVVQAGLFPLLHLGPAVVLLLAVPYPATMEVWPQFRSALPWDAAAMLTYFTVSLLFWYLGLVPDLAVGARPAPSRGKRRVYGVFALGWRGSARDWRATASPTACSPGWRRRWSSRCTACVSLDFAIATRCRAGTRRSSRPTSWSARSTPASPWSLMLVIPLRRLLGFGDVITERHLD